MYIYLWITYATPSTILVGIGIHTNPVLCDSIKCAVIAQVEELKKFHEEPRLGAKGHKCALKYMYEYMRCYENIKWIKIEENFIQEPRLDLE